MSVFCGASTDTNVLRGVGGKVKVIHHNKPVEYTMTGWIACVGEKYTNGNSQ